MDKVRMQQMMTRRIMEQCKSAGMSRIQLAGALGVSVQTVFKWETGRSVPKMANLIAMCNLLGVSLDKLLAEETPERKVTRIVVTGGPCAGKTTAMSWIQNAFSQRGYAVLFVPETATELISGGAAPWLVTSGRDFQLGLVGLQLDKERTFEAMAQIMKQDKVLIVCDRGALDNKAYMSDADFSYVLRRLGQDEVTLRDGYDAVFHLMTAARGAEQFYTTANNAARTETPEQARALDDALIAAWTGHPHLRVIDNSTSFEDKMKRLIGEIASALGEPQPTETERKFLIAYPDTRLLESKPNCRRVEIVQTYLTGAPGEEVRVRQRGADGSYVYYKTTKRTMTGATRIEVEERLTQQEYLNLLMQADPACRQLRKTRYLLSENSLYYEIDVYPDWQDKAIMEIELTHEDQPLVFPDCLTVLREVTGEDAYSNHTLARR